MLLQGKCAQTLTACNSCAVYLLDYFLDFSNWLKFNLIDTEY